MNRIFFIFFLSLLFVNCTSNTILKKPKNLISKDQMTAIITDLFIADEAYSIKNENLERKINYMPLVYEKYKIDSLRFKESNLYYTSKIDDYSDILRKVDERLNLLRDQFEEAIRKKDSIERITKKNIKNRNSRISSKKDDSEISKD